MAEPVLYLGTSSDACLQSGIAYCLRGPAFRYDVAVAQTANASTFDESSDNPAVATASLVMLGPGGQGLPAISVAPHRAGTANITVHGVGPSTATLAVTVTTISKLSVTLNGFPSAASFSFSVAAPQDPSCTSFAAGYQFEAQAPLFPAQSITYGNFPAMGNGSSPRCLFSTITLIARDSSYAPLTSKTVSIPIVLGKDNSTIITIP